jgi:hypothetical protein
LGRAETKWDLAKKDNQLAERKLCYFFAKPQKQIGVVYFCPTTKSLQMYKL